MERDEGLQQHNVEATFEDEAEANRAAEAVREAGVDGSVTVDRPEDKSAVLRAEMRDEVEGLVGGPGNIGPFTKSMTKGIAIAVPIGTAVGVVLGALVGLIPWGETLDLLPRMLIGAGIGAAFGATTGFVIGGGLKTRIDREGEQFDAERGGTVGVHSDDPEAAERAAEVLESQAPKRVDRVRADGAPLGPSSEEKTRKLLGD